MHRLGVSSEACKIDVRALLRSPREPGGAGHYTARLGGSEEMRRIAVALNWLSDQDWSWWPLVKYRPAKERVISNILVLKMTPLFGTLSGLAIAVIARHLPSLAYVLVDIAVGWIAYFVIFRASFVPAWNSRARSLKGNTAGRRA